MPRDLNKGLLKYIKGPSYFKHFLIGTFGGDSARARLSGASRYIYIIATGYESTSHPWTVIQSRLKNTKDRTVIINKASNTSMF